MASKETNNKGPSEKSLRSRGWPLKIWDYKKVLPRAIVKPFVNYQANLSKNENSFCLFYKHFYTVIDATC